MSRRNASDSVGSLLKGPTGIREEMKSKGIQPKDHAKENLNKLKEMQEQQERKKMEEEVAAEAAQNVFKLSRFANVRSVLAEQIQNGQSSASQHREFLKKHTREEAFLKSAVEKQMQAQEEAPVKMKLLPEVPKDFPAPEAKPKQNFVAMNKSKATAPEALQAARSSGASSSSAEPQNPNYGKVPAYIVERKQKEAEEEARRRAEAEKRSGCPPGMSLMPDDERLSTLSLLQENKKKITEEMMRLPIVCDTTGLRKKKADLESKLAEIEDAIKIFSRSKVFVAE